MTRFDSCRFQGFLFYYVRVVTRITKGVSYSENLLVISGDRPKGVHFDTLNWRHDRTRSLKNCPKSIGLATIVFVRPHSIISCCTNRFVVLSVFRIWKMEIHYENTLIAHSFTLIAAAKYERSNAVISPMIVTFPLEVSAVRSERNEYFKSTLTKQLIEMLWLDGRQLEIDFQ